MMKAGAVFALLSAMLIFPICENYDAKDLPAPVDSDESENERPVKLDLSALGNTKNLVNNIDKILSDEEPDAGFGAKEGKVSIKNEPAADV